MRLFVSLLACFWSGTAAVGGCNTSTYDGGWKRWFHSTSSTLFQPRRRRRGSDRRRRTPYWDTAEYFRKQKQREDEDARAMYLHHKKICPRGSWLGQRQCHREALSKWLGCDRSARSSNSRKCINARRSRCGPGFMAQLFYKPMIRSIQTFPGWRPSEKAVPGWKWRTQMYINQPTGSKGWLGSRRDNFQVQWKGYLNIMRAGRYKFCLESDDGSRMRLNGRGIIDNDGLHGMRTRCGTKHLNKGYFHVNVEAFDHEGSFGCIFKYKGPDTRSREMLVGQAGAVSQRRNCAMEAWPRGSFYFR